MKSTFLTDKDVEGIKFDPIKFTTSAVSFVLTLCGVGKVKIDFGDGTIIERLLNGEESFKHRYAGKNTMHVVTIEGASNIKVLSAPKCGIESIEFIANSSIEKVVLYDNNISTLDVSKLSALQYLHIFNNPVCANEEEIRKTYSGLPDRNGKAFGSIVMYPFYPLGVLVYKNGSTLTKYPNKAAVAPVESQLYRDMNAVDVKWYKYENSAFVEQTEQNRLINLRIKMEEITLPLGWLFGSAIQYDEAEYAKCDFYFKQNHVQDYWETAEKGLGIRAGLIDTIIGKVDGFADMNILRYVNNDGNDTQPREAAADSTAYTHGDTAVSVIACRGGKMYGIAPDCQLYLIDNPSSITANQLEASIGRLTENSDIISRELFSLQNDLTTLEYIRNTYWAEFAKRGLVFAASGNDGDGTAWNDDREYSSWKTRFCYTEDGGKSYRSYALCVTGLRQNDTYYSAAMTFDFLSHEYVFTQYANGLTVYNSYLEDCAAKNGTSFSTPICTAVALLMMCVYKKIYGASASCGIESDFMRFIKVHTNPIYNEMNRSVGNGRPDLMYYNKLLADDCSVPVTDINIDVVNAIHGEGVDIAPVVAPENADNIAVTYDYDVSKLAIKDNMVYPLIEQESTIGVTAYSNMSEDCTATFNVNVPQAVSHASIIAEPSLPTALADGKVCVLGNNRAKNYTVQLLVNFADIDTDTTKKVFDFYTHDGKYNAYLEAAYKAKETSQSIRLAIDREYAKGGWNEIFQVFLAKSSWFESLEGKNYVLTFMVKDGTYEVLLNGNTIGAGDLIIPLPLYDWRINTDMLASGTAEDVLVYDRVLTYDEIIQNTIALLNEA